MPLLSKAQNADIDILKSINSKDPSHYWIQTSNSAYIVPVAFGVTSLAYALANKSEVAKQNAYGTIFSLGIGISISSALKKIVHRTRPYNKYPNAIYPYQIMKDSSFPSGHTTMSFVTSMSIGIQYGKWYGTIPAMLWSGSVGYSRMKLGEHFPTDVLAGMATGIGSSLLGNWIGRQIK